MHKQKFSFTALQTIFEDSLASNIIISSALIILDSNLAAGKLLGVTDKSELKGKSLLSFVPQKDITGWEELQAALWIRNTPCQIIQTCFINTQNIKLWCQVGTLFISNDETLCHLIIQETGQKRQGNKELIKSEKKFRLMTDSMPQQVWTASTDGALTFVNLRVRQYFGRTEGDIIGSGWQDYIHPEDIDQCLLAWQTSLESGKDYLIEFRLKGEDENYRWHLARAIPLIEDGIIIMWLGTNTDIHSQKLLEEKKDEFISIASHELKTPLTSIKAYNQLMSKTSSPDKMEAFIAKSAEKINHLEHLIHDLLDVTKINSGKLLYNMQELNLDQLIKESIATVQLLAPNHEITYESTGEVMFTGDWLRLEQTMNNFLTNAVKYSPEADRVMVKMEADENNIVVSVQDFGVGIAEEALGRLFDRYYRIDNTTMRFEGLGLGLYIISEILKRHNGSFWVESKLGEGSIFYFRLPLKHYFNLDEVSYEGKIYRNKHFTVVFNEKHSRIEVDWTGFQDVESVQKGGQAIYEMLLKYRTSKVLNDNTHVLGTWSAASDWARDVWFPKMIVAGLTHFAWIHSASTFAHLSAQKSIVESTEEEIIKIFSSQEEAEKWLDSK